MSNSKVEINAGTDAQVAFRLMQYVRDCDKGKYFSTEEILDLYKKCKDAVAGN